MAPTITSGPCHTWGKWLDIATHNHFPEDNHIFWTPSAGIDETATKWWYTPEDDPDFITYLADNYFDYNNRHGYLIFPAATNLLNGRYNLHCKIVNPGPPPGEEPFCKQWLLIVP